MIARDVNDNQHVKAGQVLIELDPRPYQAARDQAAGSLQVAQAQLAAAKVNLETARVTWPAKLASAQALVVAAQATQFKAQADARRQRSLPKQATTQQDIDNAESALRNADAAVGVAQANVRGADIVAQSIAQADAQVHQLEAQVALAQAQLDQAELNLDWTKVRAPQDGWVTKRNVDKGNYVQVGQSVMALVTPEIWVTANFKEDQLDRMRPGQRVDIGVDAFPGAASGRTRGQRAAWLRLAVLGVPGRECDGQLREDRAAGAGEDRHRQRAGSRRIRCRWGFRSIRWCI